MYLFYRTDEFDAWLSPLKDKIGKARIIKRIRSAEAGTFGDCKSVGGSVYEMRVHFGPGYRLYYTQVGSVAYLLWVGGDKGSQTRDIKRAINLARELREE